MNPKKKLQDALSLFFLGLLFISFNAYGQSSDLVHSNIWYFGNRAGVDFSSGTPVSLTDGQLDTQEGVAAIGYMKSSPKGTHIALVNRATSSVDLFNFNKNTGQVVNEVNIAPNDLLLYGLEFSANSNFFLSGVQTTCQGIKYPMAPWCH